MSIVKVHRYGVRTRYQGAQGLSLEAPGKPVLRIANPPEFRNGLEGVWSPEELLTGALAACFERTVVAIAEAQGMPLGALRVDATGHVQRKDDRYRFMLFELDVEIETDPGYERVAEHVADLAHERCLVESALEVPVHLSVGARAASSAATA
ncbi:MAG: putative Peroxiredoxin OsmC [Gaiellaceae bacterium]|jgi:organic hydroperoxide reductase OsmC/OhrA|nr:putative Peroxiredoxin OsmC [Gaiellaceae bacterium]